MAIQNYAQMKVDISAAVAQIQVTVLIKSLYVIIIRIV